MVNQLKLGAILSYVSVFIAIIIALFYTPVLIRVLGQSEYGLYSMIGSISAYLSILDMGLGNSIVRFTARNRVLGNKDSESTLNGMFFILYSLIGALTVIIGIIIYNTIENVFRMGLSELELEKAKVMVIILIINFSLSFPLAIFGSLMQAYEKFAIVRFVNIIRSISAPLITLPFLFMGYGSIMVVSITTIVNITCLLFNVYYCFRKMKIKFKFKKIEKTLLIDVISYSFFIFLGIIVDQINWNTGQIILGALVGTSAVAVFAIAIQFIRLFLQFSTSISGLFLPRVSMMVANNASSKELTNIMIKFGRIQYIIMAYILSGFILFGHEFIGYWAGKGFIDAYYMVLIIMIPITIPLIQNIGLSILQAKNLQGFRSIVLIFISIINVIISILLADNYGGFGVAFGTGLSYLLGNAIIMNIYYYKKLGINIPLFWKNILMMTIPVLLSLFIGFSINYLVLQSNFILLVFKMGFFSMGYFFLMWILGLNDYEKSLLNPITRKINALFSLKK